MKLLFFLLLPFCAFSQQRIYVNAAATGDNTGTRWADAHPDLQTAMQRAKKGDTIWVAAGMYRPTSTTDRRISFELPSGVHLYGGFSGSETQATQRNYRKHTTLLNGDIGVPGDSTDNTLCILYLHFPDSNTVVDGLTFSDGFANILDPSPDYFNRMTSGAGAYVMGRGGEAYPDFRNCTFIHNTSFNGGGGVFVNGGETEGSVSPRFFNCRFENNRAVRNDGGGLARWGGGLAERGVDLDSCVFINNYAGRRGGGYQYWDSHNEQKDWQHIRNCVFIGNEAKDDGSAIYLILGRRLPKPFLIEGTTFEGNVARKGGIVRVFPSYLFFGRTFTMRNCVFKDNVFIGDPRESYSNILHFDQQGVDGSTLQLTNLTIENNKNFNHIITVSWDKLAVDIENVKLINNECKNNIFLGDITSININRCIMEKSRISTNIIRCGGAIKNLTINNSTISNNLVYSNVSDIISCTLSDSLIIKNSNIIQNNISFNSIALDLPNRFLCQNSFFGGNFNRDTFFASLRGTYIDNCAFDTFFDCAAIPPAYKVKCSPNNLVGIDPMFRDTAQGDYTLLPCSPLINAGSNAAAARIGTTDLAGRPRIQSGRVDIGPYETPPFAPAASPSVQAACAGGSNGRVSLNSTGGCPPYTYRWRTDGGAEGSDTTGLAPGRYVFTITDMRGQIALDTLTVGEIPPTAPQMEVEDMFCGSGAGGAIRAVLPNSAPLPLRYRWSDDSTARTGLRNNLLPGTYGLTVTDALGCRYAAAATLARVGTLAFGAGGTPISCFGRADGDIWVAPSNGKAPFRYIWSTGQTDSIIRQVTPGTYIATITDDVGCTATFPFYITQPDSLYFLADVQDATDTLTANGHIAITNVSGGTPPYGYLWSTGGMDTEISGLRPGTYTATVTDKSGCTSVRGFSVRFLVSTGAALQAQRPALVIWPNPTPGLAHIAGTAANRTPPPQRLRLWDAQGRLVLETAVSEAADGRWQCSVDLSGLPAGVYVAEAENGARGKVVLE